MESSPQIASVVVVADAMRSPFVAAGMRGEQLDFEPDAVPWVWRGYLGAGDITLLTSQWKSGKTTLISILLSRLKDGGELAGLEVRPGKAVIVSEEPRALWRRRHQRLDLRHVHFMCRPFGGKPSLAEWLALLDHIAGLSARHGVTLAVIDTLTTFLPGRNESASACMMEALLPLRRLSDLGLSVLLAHHPAKGVPLAGQAARGSGALAAFTDINLEMNWYQRSDATDRRRRIITHSRHEETPRQLVLELNADADDYLVHGDFNEDEFAQNWERLRGVLEDAPTKRTRRELLAEWPADYPAPSDATLARWLARGVAAALVCQDGTGRRAHPFRYWLPGQEEKWRQDPLYCLEHQAEAAQADLRTLLTGT